MWKGRFEQETADSLRKYGESISFDWRLYKQDIAGSIAHATLLREAGILTEEELEAIIKGLREIEREIDAGEFEFRVDLEDIHMNIEAKLTERIGAAGAKLHTARSRNDQVALDLRLYLRDETANVIALIRKLQKQLVDFATRAGDAIMPGYTHLQRAQPVSVAHHLLAYVEMLERDRARFEDGRARMNVFPLGSGAIAGSTIVLNRERAAELLGFDSVSQNSMDAVSDRDFACEFLADAAICGMHLSRLSEDIIVWASAEFGFIKLSDAYTTGSSLMPQKKNPDVAELTRGKSGRLFGNLMSLLTTLKGLPLTYNRDMQEDKEAVFDSVDTLKLALEVFAGMLAESDWNAERAAAAAADPLLLATDLADYLVLQGMPFRLAHEAVGKLVAISARKNVPLNQLSSEDYQSVSELLNDEARGVFDLDRALQARRATGAPHPEHTAKRLAYWNGALADLR
jgi:argininosuccinate lyase